MTIQEMKRRKRELGYSNAKVAELSGVPLGTVQKIFSGETSYPAMQRCRRWNRSWGNRPPPRASALSTKPPPPT